MKEDTVIVRTKNKIVLDMDHLIVFGIDKELHGHLSIGKVKEGTDLETATVEDITKYLVDITFKQTKTIEFWVASLQGLLEEIEKREASK